MTMRIVLEVSKGAEYKDAVNAVNKFLARHPDKFSRAGIETHKYIYPPKV